MDDLAKVAAAGDGESLEQVEERFRLWREGRGVWRSHPSGVVVGGDWARREARCVPGLAGTAS
jgi:hypothetical protein